MKNSLLKRESVLKGKKIGNYILKKELGKGKSGSVFLAIKEKTGELFAAKCIPKKEILLTPQNLQLFQIELTLMKEIDHPNILHLYEFLESEENFYLIITYCNRGTLKDLLDKQSTKKFSEADSIGFIKQIINGFMELRKYKILHRNIKLENIFINNNRLIIGNFGLVKREIDVSEPEQRMPTTMAYELLTAKSNELLDSKADIWSIGVIYYQLLFGRLPFYGRCINELITNIKKHSNFNVRFDKTVSSESKDVINRILVTTPEYRLNWHELFHHKLFKKIDSKKKSPFVGEVSFQTEKEFLQNSKTSSFFSKTNFMITDNLVKKYKDKKIKAKKIKITNYDQEMNRLDRMVSLTEFKERATHEKNIIRFLHNTSSKLNYCSDNKIFPTFVETFSNLEILIIKKAILYCKFLKNKLENAFNSFFTKSTNPEQIKKSKECRKFKEYLNKKVLGFEEQINLIIESVSDKEIILKNRSCVLSNYTTKEEINELIKTYNEDLKERKQKNLFSNQEETNYFLFIESLVGFCLDSESIFIFKEGGIESVNFNWKRFYIKIKEIRNKKLFI